VDPRTREPARGRLAAWVAVPRPEVTGAEGAPRVAPAAVTDALTTAFMLLRSEEIEALCRRSPGLEAWILRDPAGASDEETHLLHFGGSAD
jgi:thiamine biosynthesis lipoprotein ApbE